MVHSMSLIGRFYSYIYISCDVDDWDKWFLGRAPRTRETLPDFRELGRVTRHSRVFRRLTGSQRTPGEWGVTPDEGQEPVIGDVEGSELGGGGGGSLSSSRTARRGAFGSYFGCFSVRIGPWWPACYSGWLS